MLTPPSANHIIHLQLIHMSDHVPFVCSGVKLSSGTVSMWDCEGVGRVCGTVRV